jgi:hypothetical protein
MCHGCMPTIAGDKAPTDRLKALGDESRVITRSHSGRGHSPRVANCPGWTTLDR